MSSGGTKQEDSGSRSCDGPSRPFHLHPALHSHFIPLFLPHRRRAPLTPSVTKEQGRKSSGGEMRGKGREGEEVKRSEEERSENGEMKGGRREEKKKQKEQQGEPINHHLTPTPPLIDCCRCVRVCAHPVHTCVSFLNSTCSPAAPPGGRGSSSTLLRIPSS